MRLLEAAFDVLRRAGESAHPLRTRIPRSLRSRPFRPTKGATHPTSRNRPNPRPRQTPRHHLEPSNHHHHRAEFCPQSGSREPEYSNSQADPDVL